MRREEVYVYWLDKDFFFGRASCRSGSGKSRK